MSQREQKRISRTRRLPPEVHWLFWEHDPRTLDLDRHANTILARVLEHGTLREVRWLLDAAGADRIRRFFREVPHSDVSARTRTFWRAYFRAKEPWPEPPPWRRNSSTPWVV